MGTGLAGDIAPVFLIGRGQRRLALETLRGFGFLQTGIEADALVEDKTFAVVMRAAAFLEIFQDAAVELENLLEAFAFHEGPRFFAADAAGAKHDDGLLLQLRRQFADGLGKIAEMVNADGQRVFEGAQFDFVVVARIEQA